MHQEMDNTCIIETIGLSSGAVNVEAGGRPHRHNEVELNFLERGSITYLFGKQKIVVSAGQLIVFWAIMPHFILEAAPDTTIHWLTFPPGRFLQWHLPEAMTRQVLQGQMIWDQKERQREYELFSQWHHDLQVQWPDYEQIILLEVEARLRRIAQSMPLHPSLPTQPITTRLPRPVEAMISLITEHYMEPLQLGQIAQAIGLHPGYATDLFRKTIGITIMDYLAQHRIAHAQRLLATTNRTVLDIAMEVGFNSASRFYATFQKITGQSPRAYRVSLFL
ncbi:AraC family transcriptional regulator [Ktedonobacter sp. SOSP1-85]|uniref:helix-turn-helix domain-containing protein n=1 Tax=Ktedonobacter sp. SOSP1-85 TaxID=2778367 RepID=UPI001915D321|nr:helix-turn-helix domain-containing protein [Ktedonobacter sp. SOSP1-85]GHO73262.1 AraC family transcriptional regulator [Ktedonobacter sp. SOSP1-85]